ncbi:hypothetical protein BN865_04680c [Campylobacter coli 76339]|nr:hypothetical protein BN865_04680c [Campylobacter coli 76339]
MKALMARKVLILQKFSLIFDEFKKDFRVWNQTLKQFKSQD